MSEPQFIHSNASISGYGRATSKLKDSIVYKGLPLYEIGAYRGLRAPYNEIIGEIKSMGFTELVYKNKNMYADLYDKEGNSKSNSVGQKIIILSSACGSITIINNNNEIDNEIPFYAGKDTSLCPTDSTSYLEFSLVTSNEDEFNNVSKFLETKTYNNSNCNRDSYGLLMRTESGYRLHYLNLSSTKLKEDNYSKETISQYKALIADLNSEEPMGRLGIFFGPPGTGKTHLIQSLLGELKSTATRISVPLSLAHSLDSPEALSLFISLKQDNKAPIVIILEDCDSMLIPRSGDNMSSISSILNLTDGLLGKRLDIKIIASTNAPSLEFDAAITRAGRLSQSIEVGLLPIDHANRLAASLMNRDSIEEKYHKPVSLADVYRDVRLQSIQDKQAPEYKKINKKRKVGF